MSFWDRIKSMFAGGSEDSGARPAAEPDAATAMDDAPETMAPMPPTDPAGTPMSTPAPAEPMGGTDPIAEGGDEDQSE